MSLKRAQEDLAAVEAEIAGIKRRLEENRAQLDGAEERAGKLRATIEVLSGYEASPPASVEPEPPKASSTEAVIDPSSPYYGKSLAAAALMVLAREKEPLSASRIARLLSEEGWNFTSTNPPLALSWALRAQGNKTGDVVTVPGGKWDLTASRPNAEHVARSVTGLQAARARGVTLGPPRRMTEEMVAKMRVMSREGATIAQIAAELNVAEITIKRYRAVDKHAKSAGIDEIPDLGPNVHRMTR